MERVTKSDGATPLVVAAKAGGAGQRRCSDYKGTINTVLKQKLLSFTITGRFLFCACRRQRFLCYGLVTSLKTSAARRGAQTTAAVNTYLGLSRFQWIPYRISSAPAIFQSFMDKEVKRIPKVGYYIDDIIVVGETVDQCQATVKKVLQQLTESQVESVKV